LNGTLGLEGGNGTVGVLGDNITTVEQASSHIFAITWVTLNHLVVWFKARHGHLLNGVGLVRCLGSGDDWGVCNEREVDTWVWNQVGLELVKINVEGTIETERSCNGGDNYGGVRFTTRILELLKIYLGQ
jgi:hypothetical protein